VRKYHPDRVIIEMNGMWDLDAALSRTPKVLDVYQIITTVNAETFELYAKNMGQRMLQHITDADMVVFNRATEETRQLIRDRNVRSMNPQAALYFENDDGTSEDYGAGMPPPYDMDAPIIEIKDADYAVWYRDLVEETDKYDGKTVSFKGVIAKSDELPKDTFAIGRHVMTCCADDIAYRALAVTTADAGKYSMRDWVEITAKISISYSKLYRSKGPVLKPISIKPAEPAVPEVASFN
jgi:uncharacterized repeat protein (TIGR03943 family)